jgi:hypothetical protein
MLDPILLMKWQNLQKRLADSLGKRPDLNAVLFLIGVQELGQGLRPFEKEEKQDLMHIATCRLLQPLGYYELEGQDKDGWPHYNLVSNMPSLQLKDQEQLLKLQAIEYFEAIFGDLG